MLFWLNKYVFLCLIWIFFSLLIIHFQVGGLYWSVPLGRQDGTTASQSAANEQIPSPLESLENITAKFTSKGLKLKDVVVLSGNVTSSTFNSTKLSLEDITDGPIWGMFG